VRGGATLRGTVGISGSKNAALAAMCAAILTSDDVVLRNVPAISDAESLARLLRRLGLRVEREGGGVLRLNAANVESWEAPAELVTENRASFQVTGPLLARFGRASSPPPGGDAIGQRPIDVHLGGFAALGAEVDQVGERFVAAVPAGRELHGARIFMDYASVTGTQNVLMAAVLATGRTTIVNAATEPEVQDLANLLNAMGARVSGIGGQILEVEGVSALGGVDYEIMPDRIEAGTFAAAAAMTGGEVEIAGAPVNVLDAVINKLEAVGASMAATDSGLTVRGPARLQPVNIQALPYPGLPTDLHAPMAAMLTQAEGVSIIHERVFDNRMLYVGELRKMGAEIVSTGSSAVVNGPTRLHGTRVRALDVRAGASVLLAALVASGTTVIEDVHHLDRGYEALESKFRGLGVEIERN
jgi:UDP-N-acetylglucosamine 1-carboxyvinyltransferase